MVGSDSLFSPSGAASPPPLGVVFTFLNFTIMKCSEFLDNVMSNVLLFWKKGEFVDITPEVAALYDGLERLRDKFRDGDLCDLFEERFAAEELPF